MSDTSLAHHAHEPTRDSRAERGRRLYADHAGEISFEASLGVWLVPSQHDGTSVYEVTLGLRHSCECRDFEFNGRRGPCKHIHAARLAQAARVDEDLRIEYPAEEELLAACEYALSWFEEWEKHADHEHDFGGEHAVMKKLRRAIRLAAELEEV